MTLSISATLEFAKIFRVLITGMSNLLSFIPWSWLITARSCGPNSSFSWHNDTFSVRLHAIRDIPAGTEITISYCSLLIPAAARARALAPYGITSCLCSGSSTSCFEPARSRIGDERRARFVRDRTIVVMPPFEKPDPGTPKDAWAQPAITRFQELEEEGLEATEQFKSTAHQLMNVYMFLQDTEKALFYAHKLRGAYKLFENEELGSEFLSEKGIRGTQYWQMAEMQKKMSMPMLMSFA
jgi:hypothetical protein